MRYYSSTHIHLHICRLLASFALAYAMEDLSWKFYFINAAWNFVFLIIAYFTFVETKGLKLEEINAKFEGTPTVVGVEDDSSAQESITGGGKQQSYVAKTREL